MTKLNTRNLILIALFAALTAVGAFIRVPMWPVPFTLQTFFVALSGLILGVRGGVWSQFVYIVTGLVGLPVFTNGGGLVSLAKPTFGFIVGFVVCAAICGLKKGETRFWPLLGIISAGYVALYAIGIPWLWASMSWVIGKPMSFFNVCKIGFFVFLPTDALKTLLLAITAAKLNKRILFTLK